MTSPPPESSASVRRGASAAPVSVASSADQESFDIVRLGVDRAADPIERRLRASSTPVQNRQENLQTLQRGESARGVRQESLRRCIVVQVQQWDRDVIVGQSQIGCELQTSFGRDQRLVEAADVTLRDAEIGERREKARIELGSPSIRFQRLARPADSRRFEASPKWACASCGSRAMALFAASRPRAIPEGSPYAATKMAVRQLRVRQGKLRIDLDRLLQEIDLRLEP